MLCSFILIIILVKILTFNFSVVGDSGYALRPWLLTPILEAVDRSPEADYNDCQTSTRNIIERVNGTLKMRFRCLLKHRVLHYKPVLASKIINTCCALHNLCIQNNLLEVPPEEDDDEDLVLDGIFPNDIQQQQDIDNQNILLLKGRELQTRIVRRYFT